MSCVIPCCVHKGVCESSSSRCLQSSSCCQQTLQIPGRPLQKKPSLAVFPLFSCSFVSFLTPDRSFAGPRVPTNPTTPAKPQSDHRAESRVSAGLWLGFPGRIHRGTRDPFAAIFTDIVRYTPSTSSSFIVGELALTEASQPRRSFFSTFLGSNLHAWLQKFIQNSLQIILI